jgi:uncharacterized membrane protein YeaQ/YmgE (transglycosylase-associated protein family)
MIIGLLLTVIVGAVSGWVAGLIMKSKGSFYRNLVLGLVGGLLGGLILGVFGVNTNSYIWGFVTSILGACLLIWIARCINS